MAYFLSKQPCAIRIVHLIDSRKEALIRLMIAKGIFQDTAKRGGPRRLTPMLTLAGG